MDGTVDTIQSFIDGNQVKLWVIAALIIIVTMLLSCAGMRIGQHFGTWFAGKAQVLGGLLLIGIGAKIFIAHILNT